MDKSLYLISAQCKKNIFNLPKTGKWKKIYNQILLLYIFYAIV